MQPSLERRCRVSRLHNASIHWRVIMSKQASAFNERLQGHLEPTIGGSFYIKPQDMEWRQSQFQGVEIKVL